MRKNISELLNPGGKPSTHDNYVQMCWMHLNLNELQLSWAKLNIHINLDLNPHLNGYLNVHLSGHINSHMNIHIDIHLDNCIHDLNCQNPTLTLIQFNMG